MVKLLSPFKHIFELIHAYETVSILIKNFEANVKILLRKQICSVDCRTDKLSVINFSIVVCIELFNKLRPVWSISFKLSEDLFHS